MSANKTSIVAVGAKAGSWLAFDVITKWRLAVGLAFVFPVLFTIAW